MTAAVNQARDAAKAAGKGFMGQWGAQIGTSFNYHETYGRMSPDAILAETPGNFALERSGIQGVKFKTGITDDNGASTPDVMVIKTGSGKHKLQVNGALGTVKEAFRRAGIS
jgi:hypothetical protein